MYHTPQTFTNQKNVCYILFIVKMREKKKKEGEFYMGGELNPLVQCRLPP